MTNTDTPEMTGLRIVNLLKNKYALDTDKLFNNLIWSLESWKRKEGKNLLGTSAFFQIAQSFTNMHARFSNTNEVIAHLYFSAPFDEYNALHVNVEYRWKEKDVLGEITWVAISLRETNDPTISKNAVNYKSVEWPRFELESSPIELLNEMLRLKKLAQSWEPWPNDIVANEMAIANPQPMLNPKLVRNSELPNHPHVSKTRVVSSDVPVTMVHQELADKFRAATITTEAEYMQAAANIKDPFDWVGLTREIEKNTIVHSHLSSVIPDHLTSGVSIHPHGIRDYLDLASTSTTALDNHPFHRMKEIASDFEVHAALPSTSDSNSAELISNWDKPREIVANPFTDTSSLDVIGYQIAEYRTRYGWSWNWITQEEYYLFQQKKTADGVVKYHLRKVYGESLPANTPAPF